jgi:ABC-2 type transport system permease protein
MLRLVLARLRRDRVILPIWIIATGLLALASASGVQTEFPTEADREAVIKVAVATPSLLALRGLPDGGSLGAYVYFQVFCYLAVMAGLMSTFFVTRHTRADEERGRAELVGAAPLRRTTPLVATLIVGVLANVVLGVLVALGMMGGGLQAGGSWMTGLAAGAVGLCFIGIGALAAQLAPTSRSANGIGAAAVGAAFLLRAAGDALGTPGETLLSVTSAWPSWLSPIGWGQHVYAFTRQDAAPLLLAAGLALLTAAAALALQATRDLGSSLLPERRGRATGRASLRSSVGLAWRQQWPSVVGWSIGAAVLGVLAGSIATRIADVQDLADQLQELLASFVPGGTGQLIDLLVGAILGIAGILAAAAGAQAIMRARGEEADGRAELVLAAPVHRTTWLLGYVIVAVVSAVAVAVVAGLVAGLSFLGSGADGDRVWSSLGAGLAQTPAALTFIAITTLVFAVLPRATVPVGWAAIGVGFVIGQFGGLLQLPEWVRDASPFTHTPGLPAAEVEWAGAWWLLGISVVLLGLSAGVVRRRQLTP